MQYFAGERWRYHRRLQRKKNAIAKRWRGNTKHMYNDAKQKYLQRKQTLDVRVEQNQC